MGFFALNSDMKRSILSLLSIAAFLLAPAQEVELVKDLFNGSSYPHSLCTYQGKLYFTSGNMWQSDGTNAGTVPMLDKDGQSFLAGEKIVYKDKLFFSGSNSQHGKELWVSDGTQPGTFLLKDLLPGSGSADPRRFVVAGNYLYFTVNNTMGFSVEIWRTDGTAQGTIRLKDINPGKPINTRYMIALGNRLFFDAEDSAHGMEMWVSDGTEQGTHLFMDVDPGPVKWGQFYEPFVFKNRIYFTSAGSKLWVSDGTVAGTYALEDSLTSPTSIRSPMWYAVLHDQLYFAASNATVGKEIWTSDGTDTGTKLLLEMNVGTGGSAPTLLFATEDHIYFSNISTGKGNECWITDGTAEGTKELKEINPGVASAAPSHFGRLGNQVFFAAEDGSNGRELWTSDGTDTGTKKIKPAFATAGAPLDNMHVIKPVSLDTALFFVANFDDKGAELYKITFPKPAPNALVPLEVKAVHVFPNPFDRKVYIESEFPLASEGLVLVDAMGRRLRIEGNGLNKEGLLEVNLPGTLAPGVYFLFSPDLSKPIKLIKQ